jgi:hypothetical protein
MLCSLVIQQTHTITCYPQFSLHPLSLVFCTNASPFHILFLRSMLWLLVTAKVVPSSPILAALVMEVICSSETSVLTRAMWHNIL